ncbi:MAG: helix-turn-helix transcriptional regulator, partial [Blautia sp.]|nr:helix-turn-helix transcriptional regulator [Blautia sp.]
ELLTDTRLKEAIYLTQEGVLTTRQISEALGYASPKYFTKVFKKGTGLTVAEMRELL